MAKKKPQQSSPRNGKDDAQPSTAASPEADLPPEVEAAEAVLRKAEAELRRAKRHYSRIRRQATDNLKRARESNLTDLVDGTLKLVKKHPAPGVLIAAAIGFFLGRLFRR